MYKGVGCIDKLTACAGLFIELTISKHKKLKLMHVFDLTVFDSFIRVNEY